ncbi:MAG: PHP domain-containing protein [Planctomycetota bacterium]|nr:MAG: PHP domain-containing protein [Planctomycetota bacterium]
MRVDFHIHTNLSDGALDPEAVLELIAERKLKAWAITDHDLTEASQRYEDIPGAVSGCEVTTWAEGREVHVVALGTRLNDTPWQEVLCAIRHAREEYLVRLCQWLRQQHGIDVPDGAGRKQSSRISSRAHLAAYLHQHHVVRSVGEAFQRYLGDAHIRHLAPPNYPPLEQAVAHIQAAGGVAILAHPAHYRDYGMVERLLHSSPLDGLEVRHPGCDSQWRSFLEHQAQSRGLLMSCGSDFHYPGPRRIGEHRLDGVRLAPLLERLNVSHR